MINSDIKEKGLASFWVRKGLESCKKVVKPGSLLLDIGSGDSPYREIWGDVSYFSMDLSSPSAQSLARIEALPLAAGSMDVVVCTEVLEHVYHVFETFLELHRILRPDGYLIFSTPLIMGVHEQVDYFRYTPQALSKLVSDSGFELIDLQPRGGVFSCIGLLLIHSFGQLRAPRPTVDGGQKKKQNIFGKLLSPVFLLIQYASRVFVLLDALDKKKNFTLGYVVLCRKEL